MNYNKPSKRETQHKSTKADIITRLIIILMILIVGYYIVKTVSSAEKPEYDYADIVEQTEKEVVETQRLRAEADLTKAVLDVSFSKADKFVVEICNDIEYITYTEKGTNSIKQSRTAEDIGWWKKTFSESNITVNFDYEAIFSISTKDINVYISEGIVYIEYDPNIIDVRSIEVSNITTSSDKDWFGKKYSNQEVVSILELAKEDIYEELNNDASMNKKSCDNLNDYFLALGGKMDIDSLVINNEEIIEKDYEFIDNGTIAYNHSNLPLDEVTYIVLHSTGVDDVSALQFYNNLNTYVQKREASAHYFVDDKNVVECLPTNLQAWHCFCKEPLISCTNQNSIGVEVCQFTDPDRQQKAIENAENFIKDILMLQFYSAKLVMHRQVNSHTSCPSIISNEMFNELFN